MRKAKMCIRDRVISIVCRQLTLFSGVSITPDISRVTDNSKVTDHHAILPTVQLEKQDVSALPQSCLLYTSWLLPSVIPVGICATTSSG